MAHQPFHTNTMLRLVAVVAATGLGLGAAQAEDQIRIVGSSTVYPFSSHVAEHFGKTTRFPAPIVESTGSGGGHKLFGTGVGSDTPSITNSSRKMKEKEFDRAVANGIDGITEAVIGYDGIAIAQSKTNPAMDIKREHLLLAVAAKVPDPAGSGKLVDNPYTSWDQIDSHYPKRPIRFYGPPTTSGTRDAFEELAMQKLTKKMDPYGGEKYSDIRQDGVWVDSGENDNLIVQKLTNDTDAFGVFGYSFLEENRDKISGAAVSGINPTPETISSGLYPISRSLFFYIKHAHADSVPGLMDYVQLFMQEDMIGPNGALKKIGLIPLPEKLRKASQQRVLGLVPLEKTSDGKLQTLEDYAASL